MFLRNSQKIFLQFSEVSSDYSCLKFCSLFLGTQTWFSQWFSAGTAPWPCQGWVLSTGWRKGSLFRLPSPPFSTSENTHWKGASNTVLITVLKSSAWFAIRGRANCAPGRSTCPAQPAFAGAQRDTRGRAAAALLTPALSLMPCTPPPEPVL